MNQLALSKRHLLSCAVGLGLAAALVAGNVRAESVYAVVTEPVGSDRLAAQAGQFEAWRKAGMLTNVKLLHAQPGQKEAGFANLAVVTLGSEKSFKAWQADAASKLGKDTLIRRADLVMKDGTASKTPATAVHVASLYATHVSPAEYKKYTEKYIAPNMNLQRAAGIMPGYSMYIEREPVAGQTRSLLIMEYANEAAYAQREPVKASGKQKLSADAEWKRINDMKETIRTDISSTASNEVGAAALQN